MKKIHIVLISLLLISVLVGSFALYKIISEINEVNRAEELSNEFLEYSPDKDINSQLSYKEIFDSFKPQLLELKNVNPHVVGWIYIPGTNINYPLLQGNDNEYYLNHSVRGEYSAAGSIFIDERGLDFPNVIVYGHNMGRSSNVMFHDITNFNNIDYFNSITKGYIIYENAVTELNIFAYSLSKSGTDFYKENVSLDFIKNNSINYREPLVEGKLYTLSTCAYDYKDARGILSCIGEEVYEYHN